MTDELNDLLGAYWAIAWDAGQDDRATRKGKPIEDAIHGLFAKVRAAALEEAAKVAEDEFDAYSCAGAIRALIDPPK
jgi:hypothetical protein